MRPSTTVRALTIFSMLFTMFSIAYAGDLTPPAAPGPTMKTLAQVEPRTPMGQDTTPSYAGYKYRITTPGSYYLTEDTDASGDGILVSSDDVTIDLQGYTLKCSNTGNGDGIAIATINNNVEIRNGTIKNFKYGITESHTASINIRVIGVTLVSNTERGINLIGNSNVVRDCIVADNGISADTYYVNGINVGSNSIVTGNVVHGNGTGATASSSIAAISAGSCCVVTNNTVYDNGHSSHGSGTSTSVYGISTGSGCTITGNTIYDNANSAEVKYIKVLNAGEACVITQNSVYSNANLATFTTAWGIRTGDYCLIDKNVSYDNGINITSNSTCVYGINATL